MQFYLSPSILYWKFQGDSLSLRTRDTIVWGEITALIQICTLNTQSRRDKERNCKCCTGNLSPTSDFLQDFSDPSRLITRRFREYVPFSYILGRSESCNTFVFVFFPAFWLCFILCLLFSIETNKNILKHFLFDCGNEKATALIASRSPADQCKYAQHSSIVPRASF